MHFRDGLHKKCYPELRCHNVKYVIKEALKNFSMLLIQAAQRFLLRFWSSLLSFWRRVFTERRCTESPSSLCETWNTFSQKLQLAPAARTSLCSTPLMRSRSSLCFSSLWQYRRICPHTTRIHGRFRWLVVLKDVFVPLTGDKCLCQHS